MPQYVPLTHYPKDLAGKPRILGAASDMGCYERMAPGLVLLVR